MENPRRFSQNLLTCLIADLVVGVQPRVLVLSARSSLRHAALRRLPAGHHDHGLHLGVRQDPDSGDHGARGVQLRGGDAQRPERIQQSA